MAWKIQMRSLYKEADLWDIVQGQPVPVISAGTTTGTGATAVTTGAVVQEDIDNWNKRYQISMGEMTRRCEVGPLGHIADSDNPHTAWTTLQTMFENIGTAAMTVLHQRFFGAKMKESDSIEEHIHNMRKLQEQINLAIAEEGGDKIKELQFICQIVTSLPKSWDIFISILDFSFDNTADQGGLLMSKKIQNHLLAEDLHCKACSGDSSFFTSTNQSHDNRQGQ